MGELTRVCDELLSNTDASVSLSAGADPITIEFVTREGTCVFECSQLHLLRIVKHPLETESFFVSEVRVTDCSEPAELTASMASAGWSWSAEALPERAYTVEVRGGIEVSVVCASFNWRMVA
jgi:hypothetical protein